MSRILDRRPAGPNHSVVTVESDSERKAWRREPCGGCPWRVDQVGAFPPATFLLSARTAQDMARNLFACHESGAERPATCAGFLLRGAEHNLAVRLGMRASRFHGVTDGGHALHHDYVEMAVANGCDPASPELLACRRIEPVPKKPAAPPPSETREAAAKGMPGDLPPPGEVSRLLGRVAAKGKPGGKAGRKRKAPRLPGGAR